MHLINIFESGYGGKMQLFIKLIMLLQTLLFFFLFYFFQFKLQSYPFWYAITFARTVAHPKKRMSAVNQTPVSSYYFLKVEKSYFGDPKSKTSC